VRVSGEIRSHPSPFFFPMHHLEFRAAIELLSGRAAGLTASFDSFHILKKKDIQLQDGMPWGLSRLSSEHRRLAATVSILLICYIFAAPWHAEETAAILIYLPTSGLLCPSLSYYLTAAWSTSNPPSWPNRILVRMPFPLEFRSPTLWSVEPGKSNEPHS
jgi:hypothetical protein